MRGIFFFFLKATGLILGLEIESLSSQARKEYPYTTHTHMTSSLSVPPSRCHVAWLDTCPFEIRRQLGMAAQRAFVGHWREGRSEGEGEKTGCQMRQRADRRKEQGGEGGQRERAPRVYKYVCVRSCVCVCVCVLLCAHSVTCVGVRVWMREREEDRRRDREGDNVCVWETSDFTPIKCNHEALTHSWPQHQCSSVAVFTPSKWNRWSRETKLTTGEDPQSCIYSVLTVLQLLKPLWRRILKQFDFLNI